MLELLQVSMHYDTVEVLRNISLQVERGEFAALIGPSGCGKSTLFKLIGGLLTPTAGEIWLEGKEITGKTGHVSYVPQQNTLFPWRTVESNAALALEVAGVSKQTALAKARAWLPRVGLGGYEKAYPDSLSGGMQQRVSFLRALLAPQELMCLDEPFGALDALTRSEMQQWLLDIWEEHRRTVLLVTHSIEEALLLADRVFVLSARPAQIIEEIIVPFPRPRNEKVIALPEFTALRQKIHSLLAATRTNVANNLTPNV